MGNAACCCLLRTPHTDRRRCVGVGLQTDEADIGHLSCGLVVVAVVVVVLAVADFIVAVVVIGGGGGGSDGSNVFVVLVLVFLHVQPVW